ncbi:MAG: hypothetical protein ACOC1F_01805 [Myxococcota bacterium]
MQGATWSVRAIIVLLASLGLAPSACRGQQEKAGAQASSASARASEAPSPSVPDAGSDVMALLGGLEVGQSVAGYKVRWISGVGDDGVVRLGLERGGMRMRVALALDGGGPRPPVRAGKYALYYEGSRRLHSANPDDCLRVLEALAKRIGKVEASVAVPKGLGPMPLPSVTL